MNIYPNKRNKNHSEEEFWKKYHKLLRERIAINERLDRINPKTHVKEYILWRQLLEANFIASNLLIRQSMNSDDASNQNLSNLNQSLNEDIE